MSIATLFLVAALLCASTRLGIGADIERGGKSGSNDKKSFLCKLFKNNEK